MRKILASAVALALLWSAGADAQPIVAESATVQSASGQFVAHPAQTMRFSRPPAAGENILSLKPSLLIISCERIKQALWRTLGATGAWSGKIHLHLRPARTPDEQVTIVAQPAPRGWVYHVHLPDTLEQASYVRAIVQVLLLELANRTSGTRSAEIPVWLTEGLSEHLLAAHGREFILPPPQATENGLNIHRMIVEARRQNPLEAVRTNLQTLAPLTFDELSWPVLDRFTAHTRQTYRSSAHLFVHQLLQLPGGRECMVALIRELPHHLNWQLAFLKGYQGHFQRLLDVEKWWALQVVQFTGRDLTQMWTAEESLKRLEEIVLPKVEVRSGAEELPSHQEVTLQSVIRDWDPVPQTQMLQRKLQELELVRLRVSQDVIGVVDEYRQVISNYLQNKSSGSGRVFPFLRRPRSLSDPAADLAVQQLNALDARRAALRKGTVASASSPDGRELSAVR